MRRERSSTLAWLVLPPSPATSTRWRPWTATSPISSAIVCRPSPARRSTQVRTRKWVPAACAAQKNSSMSFSRSPMRTSRAGSPRSAVAGRMFSSQRMLSFASSGTLVGELGRVLQHQDQPVGGRDAAARRAEMAGEDLGLADRLVRQEAIGGLGVGPVLTGQGDGRTDRACHPREELAQPPAQPFILERRASEFLVYPGGGIPAGTIHRAPGPYVSALDNASRPGRSAQVHGCTLPMWVIASPRQRLPRSLQVVLGQVAAAGLRSPHGV